MREKREEEEGLIPFFFMETRSRKRERERMSPLLFLSFRHRRDTQVCESRL